MGDKPRFPLARYTLLPGAGLLGAIGWFALVQAASQHPSWDKVPWLSIAIIAMTFMVGCLLGLLYADFGNRNSQLHLWLHHRRDFGESGHVICTKVCWDPGTDHGGKNAFIDIKVPFTFLERSQVASVRITAIRRFVHANRFSDYQWEDPARGAFLPGSRLDILIARMTIDPQHPGYYGDLSDSYIGTVEEHGFKIEIFSRTYVQSKDLYVKVPHHSQDIAIQGTYDGSRFFLVESGEAPFKELAERMERRPSRRTVWERITRRH